MPYAYRNYRCSCVEKLKLLRVKKFMKIGLELATPVPVFPKIQQMINQDWFMIPEYTSHKVFIQTSMRTMKVTKLYANTSDVYNNNILPINSVFEGRILADKIIVNDILIYKNCHIIRNNLSRFKYIESLLYPNDLVFINKIIRGFDAVDVGIKESALAFGIPYAVLKRLYKGLICKKKTNRLSYSQDIKYSKDTFMLKKD